MVVSHSNPVCVRTYWSHQAEAEYSHSSDGIAVMVSPHPGTAAAALVELQPSSISPALHPEVFTEPYRFLSFISASVSTQTPLYSWSTVVRTVSQPVTTVCKWIWHTHSIGSLNSLCCSHQHVAFQVQLHASGTHRFHWEAAWSLWLLLLSNISPPLDKTC